LKNVLIIIIVFFSLPAWAADRCALLVNDVRIEYTKQFGMMYPYWYGVGQLKTESACRSNATAFDAGQGVAQFMPRTSTYIQSLMGQTLDPYNPQHAICMQAFYMYRIHRIENWAKDKPLWIDAQIYNGGKGTLFAEYQRAKILDWDLMKLSCQRKKIKMKWGVLDLCEVNYDYSKKIARYGNEYRRGPDQMRYW
jgi:hypothetical protein